ncbi:MAG TPA: hypothetical protein VGC10_08800 [Sphingomonas sp.]
MNRSYLIALLAGGIATLAQAQSGSPPPGYDQPPPAPLNTMPVYHEERMPPPPPGGGYHDSYGTADVEADERAATPSPQAAATKTAGKRDPRYARAHYAARIARWRARAAACEAGDLRACEGPDD